MKINIIYIYIIFLHVLLSSCSIENYSTKINTANAEVLTYINENDLDVKPRESGLVYITLVDGEGEMPQKGDKIAFHYKGYYMDGEIFESSYNNSYPLIVELGSGMLIDGLEEAFMSMNKGAKAKVIVPFYLAYKDMEEAPVPPYSNLVFELELIDFTKIIK